MVWAWIDLNIFQPLSGQYWSLVMRQRIKTDSIASGLKSLLAKNFQIAREFTSKDIVYLGHMQTQERVVLC